MSSVRWPRITRGNQIWVVQIFRKFATSQQVLWENTRRESPKTLMCRWVHSSGNLNKTSFFDI